MIFMSDNMSILQSIENSDLILVGIGEEFEAGMIVLEQSEIYKLFLEKLSVEGEPEDNYEWMYSSLLTEAIKEPEVALSIKSAYDRLAEILNGKNYYVITMNMDSLIFESGLDENRIVAPFGSYNRLQCENGCTDELYDGEDYNRSICDLIRNKDVSIKQIKQEVCDKCGSHLVENTVNANKYIEKGYIDSWQSYQKWLMGTVNKKCCILELGVTMQFPRLIRWPFEKIATYNLKSDFYRIGQLFFDIPPELKDRGISISKNAVEYIKEL